MKSATIPGDHAASVVTDIHPVSGNMVDSLNIRAVEEAAPLEDEESSLSIPLHPLGVKPSGNAYAATENARHGTSYFQILPDEILALLLEYFESDELRLLGSTCKAFYAFCRADDLWKSLFIEYVSISAFI